jgi:hypothetical protein
MTSLQAAARAAVLIIVAFVLAACGAQKSTYAFSAQTSEITMGGEATVDVRLIHEPTGKPVENAVIFETRFDMSPDSMGAMTAPVTAEGSPEPGVYRFKIAPTMAGRWALTLSAKVQGEAETITGTVVVTAR